MWHISVICTTAVVHFREWKNFMKKFIQVLSLSAVTTTTSLSVVACGKKAEVSTDDNILVIKLLIDEFIAEVNQIIFEHQISMRSQLVRFIESNNFKDFFTKENIIKYGIQSKTSESPTPIGVSEWEEIINSFSQILNLNTLQNKLERLITDTDKYQIIITGDKVLRSILFDPESFLMKYTQSDAAENNFFLATAGLRIDFNIQYLDYNKTVIFKTISDHVNLTITDSGTISVGIKNLENNLATDLVNADSDLVWIKATSLGYQETALYKAFELFGAKKRLDRLGILMKKNIYESSLESFIKEQDYLNGTPINLDNLKLDASQIIIQNDKVLDKVSPIEYTSNKKYAELDLRYQILEKYQGNEEVDFIGGRQNVSKELYKIINDGFAETYLTFKNSLETKLTRTKNYRGEKINKNNFLAGECIVDGLNLNFEDLGFVLPINSISLKYQLSLNEEVIDEQNLNQINQTSLGEAVFFNTVYGIKAFQSNYGTTDTDIETYLNTIFREENINKLKMPLKFWGNNPSRPLKINIWDSFKNEIISNTTMLANFNDVLSLNQDNLTPIKYNLLNDGYQGTFDLRIFWMYHASGQLYNPSFQRVTKIPIPIESNNWEMFMSQFLNEIETDPNKVILPGYKLELNFMKLYLGLHEFNNGLGMYYRVIMTRQE